MAKINITKLTLKKETEKGNVYYCDFTREGSQEPETGEVYHYKDKPVLVPGEYEAEITYDDQYKRNNIKLKAAQKPKGNFNGGGGGRVMSQEEREQIARNSGVNYAVQLFATGQVPIPEGKKITEYVLVVADRFSKFILTGEKGGAA